MFGIFKKIKILWQILTFAGKALLIIIMIIVIFSVFWSMA